MLRLACDGPYNGQYIDYATATAAGYEAAFWPNGELVWMLRSVLMENVIEAGRESA